MNGKIFKNLIIFSIGMILCSVALMVFGGGNVNGVNGYSTNSNRSNNNRKLPVGEGAPSPTGNYDAQKAQEERVKNIKNDKVADEWRFVKDASKDVTINNKSNNKNLSCYDIALDNKNWIPGGWTLNCVDELNSKDTVNNETAGLTYSDTKTIYILNKYSNYSILSVMIHEIAHAYDFTYFNDNDRAGIAVALHQKPEDFYSNNYQKAPYEEWARGYSYCYTNTEVDPIKYPRIDCDIVNKYVKDVYKRLGVNISYRQGYNPLVPLNNRGSLPKIPYLK